MAKGIRPVMTGLLFSALLLALTTAPSEAAQYTSLSSNRVTQSFNRGWLYNNTDNTSFSTTSYNDASWMKVCTPHANKIIKHAWYKWGVVYTSSGAEYEFTSWYRKHYTPPAQWSGRRFLLEFEGVTTIAAVYVNGTSVTTHKGGYTPFTVEITSQLVPGQDNVIAVQVNSLLQSDIPPETGGHMDFCVFGGINRNVNLIVVDPLHVDWNFVSVPNCSTLNCSSSGIVTCRAKVVNNASTQKNCTVTTYIVDAGNNIVSTGSATSTVAANSNTVLTFQTTGPITHFWGPDDPYLYNVYTQVQDGSTTVDVLPDRTGFRSIYFSKSASDTKFYINGKPLKLRGMNRHESFPFFGRSAARRLQRKDADILKYDLGCNMVRCSHYTQAPDFIKRCDEIGIMLLQEVPGWQNVGSSTAWKALLVQDLVDMIYRDRNRPSVISFGVRVNESGDNDALYGPMNDSARKLDPSRPTHGVRMGGSSFLEDIWTQNFAEPTSSSQKPFITTESVGHSITPQAFSWCTDDTQYLQVTKHITEQNTSYGNQYSCGKLCWCAFDYNSTHANATTIWTGTRNDSAALSPHGVASIFRIPKLCTYFFQSQRDPALYGPMVFIASDWTARSPDSVLIFSNCDSVELFLNGTSLGKKKGILGPNLPHPAFSWRPGTPRQLGTLRAVGYIGGVQRATHSVSTPSAPVRIVLTPDTTTIYDGGDMTRIVVSLLDSSGRAIRGRADTVAMSATGAGDFIGEDKAALEGGQFAFYVKTRDSVYGTISCQASVVGSSTITPGSATITVIPEPNPATAVNLAAAVTPADFAKPVRLTMQGNRFIVPAGIAKGSMVSIYDVNGRLLYRSLTKQGRIVDLAKLIGAARGVYVVQFGK